MPRHPLSAYEFPIPVNLTPVLDAIIAAGGRPIIIGGAVRDFILGLEPKDLDVEVYKLQPAELELALSAFKVDSVGRAFGVLKVTNGGETYDVSMPRTESKSGTGHRGFDVNVNPHMTPSAAAQRRDFTINTVGWDCVNHHLIDPHCGLVDISDRVLRHVGPAFAEDPLRVLRGIQFAARFGMTMAPETIELCRSLVPEMRSLPVERLWTEWVKLLTKSPQPSVGLSLLVQTGAVELFPEVAALIGVPQEPEWHPEGQDDPLGSLWVHNCMVTDSAVRVLNDDGVTDQDERLLVVLGAFCHDFGKPSTTEFVNGRTRSLRHEAAGEAPTRSFLASIGAPPAVIEAVVPLVTEHLKPFHLVRDGARPGAVRRLALRVPLERLCRVARADFVGRTTPDALATSDTRQIADINLLMSRAAELAVADGAPRPILMGRHLLLRGMSPGPKMGALLKAAFEAQLDGAFDDERSAIDWAERNILGFA